MTGPTPIRVLLVDDHTLFRRGIATLLRAEPGFEVVGEAGSGEAALAQTRELMPDVILMDISMPHGDGLEATQRIKEELPYVRIVILTVSEEDQKLFAAIRAGAQGYLLKRIEPATLFETLRGAVHGESAIPRAMASKLLAEFARQARRLAPPAPPQAALTDREREVLGLIALGRTNKEIAAALAIAENTVKNHLKNILEKLHLENRVQVATFALREGLVAGSPR